MPNHVSHILKFVESDKGENYKEVEIAWEHLKEMMCHDDNLFDFNELLPYPEDWAKLDKEAHEETEAWLALPAEQRGPFPMGKDGYNQGGYEWCIEHWGTKWNAYNVYWADYYEGVSFQTAWSTPQPIFELIAKRFPEMELQVEYADEDTGSNCGILRYKNGELVSFEDKSHDGENSRYFARAIKAEQQLGEQAADHQQEVASLKKQLEELQTMLTEKV